MSVLSDLDLLYRDGAVTQNDFIERGVSPERAAAYAGIVAETRAEEIDHIYATNPAHNARAIIRARERETRDAEVHPRYLDDDGFYTVHDTER